MARQNEQSNSNVATKQDAPNAIMQLDEKVKGVLGSKVEGFQKAYIVADAVDKISAVLTEEYMKPIMLLQNKGVGFMTDKPNGYDVVTIKNCLIEAVIYGVQVTGNQFNIISGRCYITKEGYGYLLKNISGLNYSIIQSLPRIDQAKGSAAVVMKLQWQYEGVKGEKEIDFAIRVNQYMSADGIIGKATRKARKWLYEYITGTETPDGDNTEDGQAQVVSSTALENSETVAPVLLNTTIDTTKDKPSTVTNSVEPTLFEGEQKEDKK